VLPERTADRFRLDRSAAEGEHRRALVAQRVQRRLGLEHAELRFASLLEDLRYRLVQRPLQRQVEIDETAPDAVRDLHSERRLARAHEADQRDVLV